MFKRAAVLLVLLGFILAVQSRGAWVKKNADTLAWLRTVHFVDATHGFVGGSNGVFLVTDDGGNRWIPLPRFTGDTIRKIYFSDRQNGWVLCERDIYNLGSADPSYLMRTTDGGRSWIRVSFRDSNRRRITGLTFFAGREGIAVGEMGTVYRLEAEEGKWDKKTAPSPFVILDAAFGGRYNGAIVGGGGSILFTEDGGASWSRAAISDKSRAMLRSVYFVDSRYAWAAGSDGRVLQTINGGRYWRAQRTGTKAKLNSIGFKNNARGWVVGEDGTILETTTGGNVWTPAGSGTRNTLEQLFVLGDSAWIVGFGGTILKWESSSSQGRKPKLKV